jgi:arabinofuranan 3-O-arabinosyltransferase
MTVILGAHIHARKRSGVRQEQGSAWGRLAGSFWQVGGRCEARATRDEGVTRGERILYAVLAVGLAVVVFANDWGAFAYDTKPELYQAPWRTLLRELSAWRPSPHLGQPNDQLGFAPVVFVVWLIRALGAEPWVAMRVLRVALLVVGSWGMVRHVRALAPSSAGSAARITAAVAYAANPYAIVSGATLPVLLPYAFLPWLLGAFLASLRAPRSWRGPAAFGLFFFASGGMNAGVVPLTGLLALPAYVVYVRVAEGCSLREQIAPVLRCGLLALAVSLYWLVPSLLAARPDAVAQTFSYAESLRLLGLSTIYDRPVYFTNALAVLATFAVPIAAALAALLSRARARLLAALLLAAALPLMVRTTNTAGAVAAVAIVLLLALGAEELVSRARCWRPWVRVAAAGLGALAVVGATMPAWTGDLHPTQSPIPDYWREASAALDAGDPGRRVMFAPGQSLAWYRWGHTGVDDLDAALLQRPVVWRRLTAPAGSPEAANFLAAMDVGLHEGTSAPGVLPAFARYAGVDDVLLRNDIDWRAADGTPPAVLTETLAADPELRQQGHYGEALRHFRVTDPRPVVRAEPASGTLLVDGDNFALPALHAGGLLAGGPAYRLLASLTPDEFARALADGARLVMTDSNRRRQWHAQHGGRAFSPSLEAHIEVDPGTTPFADPAAQTVAVVKGGTATATSVGSTPFGSPAAAFDGDSRTAWSVGIHEPAVGQSLTLDLDRPRQINRVVLEPVLGPRVRIARVRLRVADHRSDHDLPDEPVVTLDVPATTASTVTIEITELRGAGSNAVGFHEVRVGGVRLETVARLPRTAARLAGQLDAAGRRALEEAALDVVLTREAGHPADTEDDEERRLARAFTLPVARSFSVGGRASAGPDVPDGVLDRLAGASGEVTATSSSRSADGLSVRAAKALDGDPRTAWMPDPSDEQPWLDVTFPHQRLEAVEIEQGSGSGLITEVVLDFGDGAPVRARLDGGRERIAFAPRTADRVRLSVTERGAWDAPVGIAEFVAGTAALPQPPDEAPLGCAALLTVDGAPLQVGLGQSMAELEAGVPATLTGCGGERLRLEAGAHLLRAADGWLVDRLHLSSGEAPQPPPPAPTATVLARSATSIDVEVGPTDRPYYLVTGQSYDERWRAVMDGRDLGPPILVDGYAAGWRVDEGGAHRFAIVYGPQRAVVWTRWASVAALVACVLLLFGAQRPLAQRSVPAPRLPRAAWAASPILLWMLLGWVGAAAGAALAVWHLTRPPAPRTLLRGAVTMLTLVPLAWLIQGLPDATSISSAIVTSRLVPHYLAAGGLVLLVVGVARSRTTVPSGSSAEARPVPLPGRSPTPSVRGS